MMPAIANRRRSVRLAGSMASWRWRWRSGLPRYGPPVIDVEVLIAWRLRLLRFWTLEHLADQWTRCDEMQDVARRHTLSPPPSGANQRIRHHPPAHFDSCSTG